MARTKPPTIPEGRVPVVEIDALKNIIAACKGTDFDARRDTAIIRLLIDSGMRASELVGLKVGDLDRDLEVAIVEGKGRRQRACPYGPKTSAALDRYLRTRARHPHPSSSALWLGKRGALGYTGLRLMVKRWAIQGGLDPVPCRVPGASSCFVRGSPVSYIVTPTKDQRNGGYGANHRAVHRAVRARVAALVEALRSQS